MKEGFLPTYDRVWVSPHANARWFTIPFNTEQEFIDRIVLLQADVNHCAISGGGTAFYSVANLAIVSNFPNALEMLLKMKLIDPNGRSSGYSKGSWRLPLHDACNFVKKECAEILLRYGANPALPDSKGNRAMDDEHFATKWYLAVPRIEELKL